MDKNNNRKETKKQSRVPNTTKNNRRDRSRCDDVEGVSTNHPSWYYNNANLLNAVASLPWSSVLGNAMSYANELYNADDNFPIYVPGILALHMDPVLGGGTTAVDAATVAARNLYTFVRHANSGSANYEAPDLMMYVIAHGCAQAWLASLRRVYGTLLAYSTRNRYYTESVVAAAGFNYADLLENMVNLRYFINQCAAKLNTLKIPSGMSFIDRWVWLNENIFLDDDSSKPQTYLPVFRYFYKWEGYKSETGTSLSPEATVDFRVRESETTSLKNYADIVEYTLPLIEALTSEEDCGIMSGDIMKAYGDQVSQVPLISDTYVTIPLYDREALLQFHNATMYADTDPDTPSGMYSVTQENGVIKNLIPLSSSPNGGNAPMRLLDAWDDNLTPEDNMVLTRLVQGSGNGNQITCGSELVRFGIVYLEPIRWYQARSADKSVIVKTYTEASYDDYARAVPALAAFKHAPMLYVVGANSSVPLGIAAQFDNYCVVSDDIIDRMHHVAVLTEFGRTSKTTV